MLPQLHVLTSDDEVFVANPKVFGKSKVFQKYFESNLQYVFLQNIDSKNFELLIDHLTAKDVSSAQNEQLSEIMKLLQFGE